MCSIIKSTGILLQILIFGIIGNTSASELKGIEVSNQQFPFHVGFHSPDLDVKNICSGSIIGPKHILTAASCTPTEEEQLTKFLVILGCVDFQSEDCSRYEVEKVTKHPEHNHGRNEIAVLTLKTEIVLNEHAKIIPVSKKTLQDAQVVSRMGWSDGKMYYYDTETVNEADCKQVLKVETIPQEVFCTKAEVSEWANFGGPVVVDGEQIGVVVYGNHGVMDGHLRIEHYVDFINGVLSDSHEDALVNRITDEL